MKWPRDNDAELKAFYGDPGTTQRERVIWESANLVYVPIPWKCFLAYDPTKPVAAIRFHRKCQTYLGAALDDLWLNEAKQSQEQIEAWGMHLFGGGHQHRLITNGNRLSTHAFACATDWATDQNRMGTKGTIPPVVRACFERQGAIWLRNDPMHCQWADSPKAMPRVALPWTAKPPPGVKYIEKHIAKPELSSSIDKPVSVQPVHTGMAKWIEIATPLIKRWESFRAKRYPDGRQYSIGYGQNADHYKDSDEITEQQASEMLASHLHELARKIAPLIKVKITANQGAALLSLAYNIGVQNLGKSTLLKLLNSADVLGAAGQFGVWIKATIGGVKKTLPGLINRRAAEKKLFLTP